MTNRITAGISVIALVALIATSGLAAQQPAPGQAAQGAAQGGRQGGRQGGQGGQGAAAFAPPPINWPAPALPDGAIMVQSAVPAHRDLRLTVTKGLSHPWAMAFLPDGGILVTERAGRLRIVRNGVVDPAPIPGLPAIAAGGLNGLLDIALHPQFAKNRWVYFTYHKPVAAAAAPAANPPAAAAQAGRGGRGGQQQFELVLARGTFDGKALTDVRDVFNTRTAASASRIVFAKDGTIFMSSGNADETSDGPPQNPNDYRGKVLRLRDDGGVPPDNPFVGRAGYKPEIFSIGHRTQLGMALNPETGELWAGEQGPNGGDEINVIKAGKNYGWPIVSYGRNYMGPRLGTSRPEMEEPVVIWIPSIAVSGLTFYTGDVFPGWKRNVFVGGLRQGESPRTGHMQRIEFNEKWEEIRREPMLRELQQRIRDVRQGPDGYLYVLTEEDNAALLRIEPAK
jgi:glucose/arabinose dehydrogenase